MTAFIPRVRAALLLVSLAGLTGCSDILEVDLPAQLGDEVLEDPAGAQIQVNTVMAQFEAAHDRYVYATLGREDVGESSTGTSNRGTWLYEFETNHFGAYSK